MNAPKCARLWEKKKNSHRRNYDTGCKATSMSGTRVHLAIKMPSNFTTRFRKKFRMAHNMPGHMCAEWYWPSLPFIRMRGFAPLTAGKSVDCLQGQSHRPRRSFARHCTDLSCWPAAEDDYVGDDLIAYRRRNCHSKHTKPLDMLTLIWY